MYNSVQNFTLECTAGETGVSYTASALVYSVISQSDADNRALDTAKALAVEYITCAFADAPAATVYYSTVKYASANNEAGYQTNTFSVTLDAGSVYSSVSQVAADTQAQIVAQLRANAKRDAEQLPIYQNRVQSWSGSCPGGLGDGYSVTVTVNANTVPSNVSQSDADNLAIASAQSQVEALLVINCIPTFLSAAQTFTATCGGGTVGTPITVTNPDGSHSSIISQVDADAVSLAAATAAANALISCAAGFWNTEQTYLATCLNTYGVNWDGADSSNTVLANTYFSLVDQPTADATALAVAQAYAEAGLECVWGGGPPGP